MDHFILLLISQSCPNSSEHVVSQTSEKQTAARPVWSSDTWCRPRAGSVAWLLLFKSKEIRDWPRERDRELTAQFPSLYTFTIKSYSAKPFDSESAPVLPQIIRRSFAPPFLPRAIID